MLNTLPLFITITLCCSSLNIRSSLSTVSIPFPRDDVAATACWYKSSTLSASSCSMGTNTISLDFGSSLTNHVADVNCRVGVESKLKRICPWTGSAVARPPSISTNWSGVSLSARQSTFRNGCHTFSSFSRHNHIRVGVDEASSMPSHVGMMDKRGTGVF